MKNAILESLFILIACSFLGAALFFLETAPFLQWGFSIMMVAPALWFVPQRILMELKK